LECKLEDANRSLEAMTIRAQKAEEERITLIQESSIFIELFYIIKF